MMILILTEMNYLKFYNDVLKKCYRSFYNFPPPTINNKHIVYDICSLKIMWGVFGVKVREGGGVFLRVEWVKLVGCGCR